MDKKQIISCDLSLVKKMEDAKIKPAAVEPRAVTIARQNIGANESLDASMEYRRRTLSLPTNTEESKIIIKEPKMGDVNKSVSLVDVFDEEMWERCMSDCRFKRFQGDTHSYEVEEVLHSLDGRDMVGIEDIYRLFEDKPMTEDKNGKVKHSEQHFEEDPVLDKEVAVITKERTKNILYSLFVKAKA